MSILRKIPSKSYVSVETEARVMLTEFFQEKFPELEKEWLSLTPSEKWNVALKLLPYIAPKLSSVTVKGDTNNALSQLIQMAQTHQT